MTDTRSVSDYQRRKDRAASGAGKVSVPLACGHSALYRANLVILDSPYWCTLCPGWQDHAHKAKTRRKIK